MGTNTTVHVRLKLANSIDFYKWKHAAQSGSGRGLANQYMFNSLLLSQLSLFSQLSVTVQYTLSYKHNARPLKCCVKHTRHSGCYIQATSSLGAVRHPSNRIDICCSGSKLGNQSGVKHCFQLKCSGTEKMWPDHCSQVSEALPPPLSTSSTGGTVAAVVGSVCSVLSSVLCSNSHSATTTQWQTVQMLLQLFKCLLQLSMGFPLTV